MSTSSLMTAGQLHKDNCCQKTCSVVCICNAYSTCPNIVNSTVTSASDCDVKNNKTSSKTALDIKPLQKVNDSSLSYLDNEFMSINHELHALTPLSQKGQESILTSAYTTRMQSTTSNSLLFADDKKM
uniref:Uncharacterized protein yfaA n=1 Tax=Lygus hesperus TaxID=30085 RepID=A0A0A9XNW1_LYGHE